MSAEMDPGVGVALERVRAGDERAFAAVYDALAPAVYGVARRVLRDTALAEEVAQEVFLEIWQRSAEYEAGRATLRGWAVMIARRRAIDRVRQEEALKNRQLRTANSLTACASVGPDERMVDLDEGVQARRAMAVLSPAQRGALELAFFDGFTYPEIAVQLGVPLGTVKTRIRDGLITLRRSMQVTGASS